MFTATVRSVEPKQVKFSDGVLPGGNVTNPEVSVSRLRDSEATRDVTDSLEQVERNENAKSSEVQTANNDGKNHLSGNRLL